MNNIIIIIGIIIFIIMLYLFYNNNYENTVNTVNTKIINYIINPSHYRIINTTNNYNKFLTTEILLNNINVNKNILDLYKNINNKLNKDIVYGIKKKDNNYRLELYLYIRNINNNFNDEDFIQKTLLMLSIIDNNIDIKKILPKLNKLLNMYNILIFSFDINLDGKLYNDIIHIYVEEMLTYYTYEYNIIEDTLTLESKYCSFNSYDELYNFLNNYDKNFVHPDGYTGPKIINNIDNIINELKEIGPECKSINFHHKYYNNSFGLYLINNEFKYLENFFKKYKYKKINDKELFNKLNFDFVINYDYNNSKIIGTGFSDFF
jgi:hypothetical protein